MKRYQVNFFSCNAEVDAEDENDAEVKAKELLYNGELYVEVESIKVVKELAEAGS